MYYVLKCLPPVTTDYHRLEVRSPGADRRWEAGILFTTDDRRDELHPPLTPIRLATEVEETDTPNEYAELYWNPIPLMSRRLVDALRSAGVDNLQTYETQLDVAAGAVGTRPDRYLAVNIVGRVQAADLARSETNPESTERFISKDFFSLAVDDGKARGLPMFRLAENVSAVLVHAHVRARVEAAGISTLTWLEPEAWAG